MEFKRHPGSTRPAKKLCDRKNGKFCTVNRRFQINNSAGMLKSRNVELFRYFIEVAVRFPTSKIGDSPSNRGEVNTKRLA